jgi:arylsulfatase A-like enzyme
MTASLTDRAGLGAIVTAGVAALVGSCAADPRTVPTGVVIITLDTTRADRLSPYGLMDVSLPALERLAREGVLFHQASTVAPLTLPAHSSLFTGLFPHRHGVRDNADRPLAADRVTLAEILREQDFETAAFVGSVVLDPERGLGQGFEEYGGVRQTISNGGATTGAPGLAPEARERRADAVVADATRWLARLGRGDGRRDGERGPRFFLWTHLNDPHRPYDPPEPFRSQHFDPYVGEIAFADSQIGRLLDALDLHRLLDDTIVIVAGDHGESLGEHGERDHGIFVYESVLRVPLIVRAPGFTPRRIAAPVRVVDVVPTILEILDIPASPMDGVSLVDVMSGRRTDPELEGFAESMYPLRFGWSPLRALRDGRFKLIDAPRPELYDLERDPFEERNLFDERRALADAMRRRVRAAAGRSQYSFRGADDWTGVPAALRKDLAALGYLTPAPMPVSPDRTDLPDPKDRIRFLHR